MIEVAALAAALALGSAAPAEAGALDAADRATIEKVVSDLLAGEAVQRIEAPADSERASLDVDVLERAQVDLAPYASEGRIERFRRLRCEKRHSTAGWRCSERSLRDWVRVAPRTEDGAACPAGSEFEQPIFLSAAEIVDLLDFVQSGALDALLPDHEPALGKDEACSIAWIEPWPEEKYDIYTRRGEGLGAGRLFEVRRACSEDDPECELSLVRAISWGAAIPAF